MKKTNYTIVLIAFLLLFAQQSKAQKPSELNEFEVSIDMLDMFSEGYPGKVLFKINRLKNKRDKGAFRLGLDADFRLTNTENDDLPSDKLIQQTRDANLAFLFGYEKHSYYKNLKTYYGADIKAMFGFVSEKGSQAGDTQAYGLGIVPFAGISYFFSKRLSMSFEVGIENNFIYGEYDSTGNEDRNMAVIDYEFKLGMPYSLTLNYNF